MMCKRTKIWKLIAIGLVTVLCLSGCSAEMSSIGHAKEKEKPDEVVEDDYSLVGAYDSADTAVISEVDEASKQITMMNLQNGRNYVLHYSGTSYVMDKYGSAMTAGQLKQGQIVNVTFLKSNRQINTLQVSADAWKYEQVERYDLAGPNNTASIGSAMYFLGHDAQVFSDGHQSDLMDIVKGDILTISGVGHEICSINIERGHGYVRLKNDHGLVGGWIEIGNKVITRVNSENMLLVVPEGTYNVKMYNDVSLVNQEVTIERNQEVVLDCSGVKMDENKTGYVRFLINPDTALVAVDGEAVNTAFPVELSFGIHQVEVSAPGYQTLSKFISVGAGFAEIGIELEEAPEDEKEDDEYSPDEAITGDKKDPFASDEIGLPKEETVSENDDSVSKNTVVGVETANKVYVDAPEGMEAFVDGVYVGLIPTSFKKVTGSHTLTIRKAGYETRSYSLYLYDDGKDITYSFSPLEEEGEKSEDKKKDDKDKKEDEEKKDDENVEPSPEVTEEPAETGTDPSKEEGTKEEPKQDEVIIEETAEEYSSDQKDEKKPIEEVGNDKDVLKPDEPENNKENTT